MPTGSTVFLVFTGVVAFAVLLQTIILLAIFLGAKQSERKVMEQVDQLREELRPLLNAATDVLELFDDMAPRIRAITVNVHTASERLRGQVDHVDALVAEATGRTRNQVRRVDQMVTDTLDGIARGTRTIQDNIMAPLRQIGGWMTAIRAAMDLLRRGGDRRSDRRSRASDEDFV
jgi:ABC-type transporter Mla subunit MlaD